jgi:hypothetical protein
MHYKAAGATALGTIGTCSTRCWNLSYGHMYFEHVYRFDDPAKLYRLRKLAPCPSRWDPHLTRAHPGSLGRLCGPIMARRVGWCSPPEWIGRPRRGR